MLSAPLPNQRRVVSTIDDEGRSCLASDDRTLAELTTDARPGYRSVNVWRTIGAPAPISAPDTAEMHVGVQPPERGTVLRVIDFPPRPADPEERRRQAAASLQEIFSDARHDRDHRQSGMHTTRSVDYAIVLSGTITAIMDVGETDLHAGDILIQRGTSHAWENRTGSMTRVAFVLIDGRWDDEVADRNRS